MTVEAFQIENFMGFENSDWIELSPITLLFGRNSTGKSAIIRALLLLRQSLRSNGDSGPLLFASEDGFDFGDFHAMVRNHCEDQTIRFGFRHRFDRSLDTSSAGGNLTSQSMTTQFDRLVQNLKVLSVISGEDNPLSVALTVHLTYRLNQQINQAELCKFEIGTEDGGKLWQAEVSGLENDKNGWNPKSDFFEIYESDDPDREWPEITLFTIQGFFPNLRVDGGNEFIFSYENPSGKEDFRELKIPTFDAIKQIMAFLATDLFPFFNIAYLGPLRPEARRFYYAAGQSLNAVAQSGQNFVRSYLSAENKSNLHESLENLQQWLRETKLASSIQMKPLDKRKTLFEVVVVDFENETLSVNLREVGSGVAQVLPVIIQAFLSPPGSLAIIEQPELHLHPGAQAELGDLFISAAKKGARFLIETHSEHLLLRIRRRLAETSVGWITERNALYITHEHTSAYYVSRESGKSSIESVVINSLGKIVAPTSFKGFFANDLEEIEMLAEASIAQSKKGVS